MWTHASSALLVAGLVVGFALGVLLARRLRPRRRSDPAGGARAGEPRLVLLPPPRPDEPRDSDAEPGAS